MVGNYLLCVDMRTAKVLEPPMIHNLPDAVEAIEQMAWIMQRLANRALAAGPRTMTKRELITEVMHEHFAYLRERAE